MGLEQSGIIDAIALDENSGEIVLILTESRPWDGSRRQLFELQEKMNAYLSFALDGELDESYPQWRKRPVRLQLDCAEPPDACTQQMIAAMREQIAFQGIKFAVRVRPGGSGCGSAATACA